MMSWCKTCLMPSTRPRMMMEDDGRCSACSYRDEYERTDWAARRAEFLALVKECKRHPVYDCVVPFSGGKDSAAIAWRLKNELGLRPLLATFGQLLWTDVGRRNWERVRQAGFDIVYWGTDQAVSRKLARRFLIERGHPKNHYDAAVNAVPLIVASNFGIPLVVYAEHGESCYGGHVLSEAHRRQRDLAEVLENQVGDDARNWAVDGLTEADLYPYIMPDGAAKCTAVYWSFFFRWSIYENAMLMREKVGFEGCEPRSDGTFEPWDSVDDGIDGIDYWMMGQKFGFGRAARMASRLIQLGVIDRQTGLDLVRKHDHEFPERYFPEVLAYLGMTRAEFMANADKHREPTIWRRDGDRWVLRVPPQ